MKVVGWSSGLAGDPCRCLRAGCIALLAVSTAACVRPFPPELEVENHDQVTGVLANAYEEVTGNYNRRTDPGTLAVAGLATLSEFEPAFSLQSEGLEVTLTLHSEAVYSFAKPQAGDVDAWAEAAADMLIAARAQTAVLNTLSGKEILEKQMVGIAAVLEGGAYYSPPYAWREFLFPEFKGSILFTFKGAEAGLEIWRLDPEGRLEADGLRKGDVVTHIDSAPIDDLSPRDIYRRLMGEPGSSLTLTVLRGEPPAATDVVVSRWEVEVPTYRLVRRDGIAVFEAPYLNYRVTHEMQGGLGGELRKARFGGAPLDGLVLDLRGNLGLGANEVVFTELANLFLGTGVISKQYDYRPEPKKIINASWPDRSDALPFVVLVDGFTGYGAEDVVAALQDNGRALVIGTSTGGDGVVRHNVSLFNMGDINMPVALAHAPSGYALAGRGVLPNICTSVPEASFDTVMFALKRGEGMTAQADRTRNVAPDDVQSREKHLAICPPELDESDLPLDLALAILREPGLYARLMAGAGS